MDSRMERLGKTIPVDMIALRNASNLFSPKQATSPVETISTPSMTSAPGNEVEWKERQAQQTNQTAVNLLTERKLGVFQKATRFYTSLLTL